MEAGQVRAVALDGNPFIACVVLSVVWIGFVLTWRCLVVLFVYSNDNIFFCFGLEDFFWGPQGADCAGRIELWNLRLITAGLMLLITFLVVMIGSAKGSFF